MKAFLGKISQVGDGLGLGGVDGFRREGRGERWWTLDKIMMCFAAEGLYSNSEELGSRVQTYKTTLF